MILSLQGCMAVGKTTAVKYIQENAPYIHISYEINTDVVDEVKRRKLDKEQVGMKVKEWCDKCIADLT